MQENSTIFGFMHIAAIKDYRRIVEEQVRLIKKSGLQAATKSIFCGIVGQVDADVINYLQSNNIQILFCSEDVRAGENLTLKALAEFPFPEDSKVWYVHTKNVTRLPEDGFKWSSGESWRHYMQYFIIERYEECLAALNEHDICGVYWVGKPVENYFDITNSVFLNLYASLGNPKSISFFGGNFWWANASHIKKVAYLPAMTASLGRFAAEMLFVNLGNPKFKCLHNPKIPYIGFRHYPPEKYRKLIL